MNPLYRAVLLSAGKKKYLRQVATRCGNIPMGVQSTFKYVNTRSCHFARDDLTSIKIVLPNYWVQTPSSNPTGTTYQELAPSSDVTCTAAIEYNGSFYPLTFNGAAQGTIPAGSTVISDWLNINIPNGALFYVRVYRTSAVANVMVVTNVSAGTWTGGAYGDGIAGSATVAGDLTLGGAIAAPTTIAYYPSAIIGMTLKPAIGLYGDSRMDGYRDVCGATGDVGEIARSIGPTFAYINVGCPGDTVTGFNASNTNRLHLAQYCSHFVTEYGINDLRTGGVTAAALEASWRTQWAALGNGSKPIFASTITPASTSTDSFATVANQSTHSSNTQRIAANAYLRGKPSPLSGYFEVTDVVESSRDSGKWQADGTASKYTVDGLHGSNFAYLAIQSAGVIPASAFT